MVEVHLHFSNTIPHLSSSISHRKYAFGQMKLHRDKQFRDPSVLKFILQNIDTPTIFCQDAPSFRSVFSDNGPRLR